MRLVGCESFSFTIITEEGWLASTANDWKTPTLKVIETNKNDDVKIYQRGGDSTTANYPQPRTTSMIRFMQWYSLWFIHCASKSGQLSTDFMRVVTQQSSPLLLMKPTSFFAVIRTALMSYLKDWSLFRFHMVTVKHAKVGVGYMRSRQEKDPYPF
ncbi:unnamed protein product [Rotaria sp. Silwood1]|nr:unnamed protein product [Rotaria sp. Silwood1]